MTTGPSSQRLYHFLADAFIAEGVERVFTLMGDGNMHWVTAMAERNARTFHARHEHCACLMAIGHYSATGLVSVASTTYGPGVTQISTALASAASARIPLVVFAGETPLGSAWHNQYLEQGPLVTASGARYVQAHSMDLMPKYVREAFYVARHERQPVVLGVPYDLQQKPLSASWHYEPSTHVVPPTRPTIPDDEQIEEVARRLRTAKRPILIAGRGVLEAGAEEGIARIAEASGALLATTLPARGLFDGDPHWIGVAGGYASPVARSIFAKADLVVAVGASLTNYTVDGGSLVPRAFVVQIDERPVGLKHGRAAADMFLSGDAKLATEALLNRLEACPRETSALRSMANIELTEDLFADAREFPIQPGTHDPRMVVEALDRVIPKDWDIVSGSGHSSYFYAQMRKRRPERFHAIREFGAIGNGLGIAMGVASMRTDGRVVLLEGDGSLIMHVQELETIARHRLPILIGVFNDGAYGSEIHKLRADGVDERNAFFGRPDFAGIAKSFGLRGSRVTDLADLDSMLAAHIRDDSAEVWDFPISDQVTSPRMERRTRQDREECLEAEPRRETRA